MSEKIMLVDIDKCIRCYTCEIACKQENNLLVGPRWIRALTVGPRTVQGELHMDFVPTLCFQCDDPPCAKFCPTQAISKREDGVVLMDEAKCTGCRLCVYGCPYGAMWFDEEKKLAGKCNFCVNRIDHGLEPSCVKHCNGGSLQFVSIEELLEITQGKHKSRIGQVCYVTDKWKLQRGNSEVGNLTTGKTAALSSRVNQALRGTLSEKRRQA